MSGTSDLTIENGVVRKYIGKGGDVVIPTGIKRIGAYAFHDDLRLRAVEIGGDVMAIDKQAFTGCKHLSRVTLHEGLEFIEAGAFDGCTALEEIYLPDTVTYLGRAAFAGCDGLKRVRLSEKLQRIGNMAFWNCTALERIFIPESVVRIEQSAFYCCDELQSVTFPSQLQKIGANAFGFCVRLTEAVLPASVTQIEELAFAHCRRLKTIVIPGVLENFRADSVFYGCRQALGIIAPQMSFEGMSCKRNFVIGFARARRMGISYDVGQEQKYLTYLRRQRKALYPYAVEDTDLLQLMTEQKCIPVEDVDGLLAQCEDVERTAILLDYKNALMTPDIAAKMRKREQRRAERVFSDAPMTKKEAKETWRFVSRDGQITITGYIGNEREVTVPDRIGKDIVTTIGAEAFSPLQARMVNGDARYELRTVVLPPSITKIGKGAFMFSGMQDLYMTQSVTEIEPMAIDSPTVTIHAPAGSYAEQYAKERNLLFLTE